MKQISERFYNSGQRQSWHYERIVDNGDLKLRVFIKRNAYDSQSYVRGYVLDGKKWNCIVDRPIEGAACYNVSYLQKVVDNHLFNVDADSVLRELVEILS